ncbi:hypothetical protein AYI69_g678 [Smittium culicis]|uniref:Uncharacterized protein n=1 Tax=Smittium culicis TaxID=133412 RepID=A0A1R1YSE1_9FUNG|nr:hypothetical protein AYI69_g678 [Smittium culicis]
MIISFITTLIISSLSFSESQKILCDEDIDWSGVFNDSSKYGRLAQRAARSSLNSAKYRNLRNKSIKNNYNYNYNPFNEGDRQFMNQSVHEICDGGQCNIDFFLGKAYRDVRARIQSKNCSSKSESKSMMFKAVNSLVYSAKRRHINRSNRCTTYISWVFVPKSIANGKRTRTMNISAYGQML